MGKLLLRMGITHLTSSAHSHESNGLAESLNRKLQDSARTMMIHAHLPTTFWTKAVNFANEIGNRLPHKAVGKSPYEAFFKQLPDLRRYRVFGCLMVAHVPKERRPAQSKWNPRGVWGVHLGSKSESEYEY